MDLTDMRVALTGATGFLGSHLARALIARGATVRGVVRRPERGKWLTELGVALHAADLADPVALTRAFEGCDAVIANAALSIRGTAPYQTFLDANRRGAIHQAQAAADARVNRLIHISTVAVYRPGLNQVNGHDRLLLDGPRLTWAYAVTNWRYALSKAHGERAIWQISRDHGLDTTVLRPGPIYGSGDRKLTASYAALMARRWLPAPTLRLPHVHARDVADAACGALANPASAGRAYNVTGPLTSPHELLSVWHRLVGSGPRLVKVPTPLWIDWDDQPAHRDLGFTPRGIESGLREVLHGA